MIIVLSKQFVEFYCMSSNVYVVDVKPSIYNMYVCTHPPQLRFTIMLRYSDNYFLLNTGYAYYTFKKEIFTKIVPF